MVEPGYSLKTRRGKSVVIEVAPKHKQKEKKT